MFLTHYHARYYALLLTRRASVNQYERYLPALMSANIDLHPHQIDAALFASRSQYRDGVILADEESMGKTIEAGIALLQASIEGRNRLLVLCPASLTAHWKQELQEKFSLPCISLSEQEPKEGVVLMSYQSAYKNAAILSQTCWDLCVLDEAHQLANASLSEHVQSDAIREALMGCPKLLLTATPMQNSLLDLYHLVRFVDETAFGSDPEVFRARYMGNKPLKQELTSRAQLLCQRTLKRQALTMQLPRRIVRTLLVRPTPEEDALSKRMSLYFHRENLRAFPKVQEHRIRLTFWKLLASSPAALLDALNNVLVRLSTMPDVQDERADLQEVADMTAAIRASARSTAFLHALGEAMRHLKAAGAPQKAVIFSENRRTLQYLHDLLSTHGYQGKIATYTATAQEALQAFAGPARILLATDSAGSGLALTQCACVINYDLPWNVGKLEQRISRVHRYGQKHDVLVLNFLDPENRAEKRMYTLLNKKLQAFDNVFGASETVLGQVDVGASLSASDVRTADEVREDISLFEQENAVEITRRVQKAEADLLAHMDAEVAARFRRYGETIPEALSQMERMLWDITRHKLHGKAVMDDDKRTLIVTQSPYKGLRLSRMHFGMEKSLPRGERYGLDHPLAGRVLEECLSGELEKGSITCKAGHGFLPGMSGELGLWRVDMRSGYDYQVQPMLCGFVQGGGTLTREDCAGLMKLSVQGHQGGSAYKDEDGTWMVPPATCEGRLIQVYEKALATLLEEATLAQDELLQAEFSKLRRWAEDEAASLTTKQQVMKAQIEQMQSQVQDTTDFAERFRRNKALAELEKARRAEEERLFYLDAEIHQRRALLMEAARRKSDIKMWDSLLFVIKWRIE